MVSFVDDDLDQFDIGGVLSWNHAEEISEVTYYVAARAPRDIFDPWVHGERGQVGI